MTKATLLLSTALVFGLFSIMSCQKQDNIQQPPKSNSTNLTLARTDGKDYRVSGDTANAWTARWRAKNEKQFSNAAPNSILISSNSLQQLLDAAAAHGTQLLGVRAYLSIDANGQTKALFTPVGPDGSDLLQYGSETSNSHHLEVYTDGNPCPPTCYLVPNILNSSN